MKNTFSPQDILDFWFGKNPSEPLSNQARWWKKDPAFDEEIRVRFSDLLESARKGELQSWESSPKGLLALVIVLDQFSRNCYRGDSDSFAADTRALRLSLDGQIKSWDQKMTPVQRWFFLMPMMHSEDREIQRRSIAAYQQLAAGAPPELKTALEGALDYARQHASIVERFGRFPHRNQILSRTSTPEELEFLKQPGSSF